MSYFRDPDTALLWLLLIVIVAIFAYGTYILMVT